MSPRALLTVCAAGLALVLQAGCSPREPVRLGFMGGLSDRGSDVGEAGRNGVLLAVEQRNEAGGIQGRKVELVVQDDGQDKTRAAEAIQALVKAKVDAVVGPFTSAMAAVAVPVANQAGLLMVSPTVTSLDFAGKDDFFIRVNRTTRDNARDYAKLMMERGKRRTAVALDLRNRSFVVSWLNEFRTAYTALGGQLVTEVPFESQADTGYGDLVRAMLVEKPDAVLFIANAVDVARLAQQANKLAPTVTKLAAEWAASETLLELGGQAVEGLLIAQPYDRVDTREPYRRFHDAFVARFKREPGYSAISAYDAATVLLQAMTRKTDDESIKAAVLKYGPYDGVQQSIQFDRFGDAPRNMYFQEIRAGQFVLLK